MPSLLHTKRFIIFKMQFHFTTIPRSKEYITRNCGLYLMQEQKVLHFPSWVLRKRKWIMLVHISFVIIRGLSIPVWQIIMGPIISMLPDSQRSFVSLNSLGPQILNMQCWTNVCSLDVRGRCWGYSRSQLWSNSEFQHAGVSKVFGRRITYSLWGREN